MFSFNLHNYVVAYFIFAVSLLAVVPDSYSVLRLLVDFISKSESDTDCE